MSKHIFIQRDNAKPHIAHNDREFMEEAMKDDFFIQLVQQPPNSPDMNVLDLGFLGQFRLCNIKMQPTMYHNY